MTKRAPIHTGYLPGPASVPSMTNSASSWTCAPVSPRPISTTFSWLTELTWLVVTTCCTWGQITILLPSSCHTNEVPVRLRTLFSDGDFFCQKKLFWRGKWVCMWGLKQLCWSDGHILIIYNKHKQIVSISSWEKWELKWHICFLNNLHFCWTVGLGNKWQDM